MTSAELGLADKSLTRIVQMHRRLAGIAAEAGEPGIAAALHEFTGFGVVICDGEGNARAAAGEVPGGCLPFGLAGRPGELMGLLRATRHAVYHDRAWLVLTSPRDDVVGVIALIDPAGAASEVDVAGLEFAAIMLGGELARLQSVADAEKRTRATLDRQVAGARAAERAAGQARQRAMLDAALDAVVSIDRSARVTYVNSAFERIFGYRAREVMGRELAEVIVPPALREAQRQEFARYLATGQERALGQRFEVTAMRADGSQFPVEVTVTRAAGSDEPTFIGYVRDITDRQRAEQELVASRARLVTAADAARQRVTRDLHDGAQQRFVSTLINLQLAEQNLERAPRRAKEFLGLALRDARHGIDDLREIAAGLHPAILTQRGLAAAIGALAGQLPIPVEIDVPDRRLPGPIEASVYFFCAEALTNIVKHARATIARLRVDIDSYQCAVEVRDDGIGGAQPRSETSGLSGLRDRINALRGTMHIISPAGGGTILQASIPLPREPASPA
jgi:PAS domain S-box-containing protein